MIRCYIGLGSNLDNPTQQLLDAFSELSQLTHCELITHSALYGSKPVGPQDQPDFVNAVAIIDTMLKPLELLDQLQHIEQLHDRKRIQHWGPRTLDLDLLLYGNQLIDIPRLQVPHPWIKQRDFVLIPMAELSPELTLPDGTHLKDLIESPTMGTLTRLQV